MARTRISMDRIKEGIRYGVTASLSERAIGRANALRGEPGTELGPGSDLSWFPSASQFASWSNLCPQTKINGVRVISSADRVWRQPRGTGAAHANPEPVPQPLGARRLLPPQVRQRRHPAGDY